MPYVSIDRYQGRPAVHPIAYHAGKLQTRIKTASLQTSLLGRLKTAWTNYRRRREDRLAFQHLLALDDSLLADIGVTRADVIAVNKLPLSHNAAAELEIIARQNKR